MTVETKVKSGGSWRTITEPKVKYSGSWRDVQQIQVKSGGSWRTVFEIGGEVVQTDIVVSQTLADATCQSGVFFQSFGDTDQIRYDGNPLALLPTGEWWSDEPETSIGDDYDVRCVSMVSGIWSVAAAGVGVWINIGAGQIWKKRRVWGKGGDNEGSSNAKGNFEIRDAVTLVVQATFTVDATAIIT